MNFTKMQGLGNDFVLIDGFKEDIPSDLSMTAVELCDRHFGIGADGLIIVLPSEKADVHMKFFNSDGSEGEMCGNALRCFSKYVYETGYVKTREFEVETLAGIMRPSVEESKGKVNLVTANLSRPLLNRWEIPMKGTEADAIDVSLAVLDEVFNVTSLFLGVPHAVIFVEDVDKIDLKKYGPAVEKHEVFPKGVNVHFVQVISPKHLKMKVWERGAGITLACGTGASAALVAAVLNKLSGREADVELPGGIIGVRWGEDDNVYMQGPAEYVFTGHTL